MTDAEARAAVDSVFRMEYARLIAGLARYTGDVGLAEEIAQLWLRHWNNGRSPAFRATPGRG